MGELASVIVQNRVAYGEAALCGESVTSMGRSDASPAAGEMRALFDVVTQGAA